MTNSKAPMPESKAYNEWNAERMKLYRKNLSEEQREHRRAYQRAYYRAHKERHLEYDREYRKRRRASHDNEQPRIPKKIP